MIGLSIGLVACSTMGNKQEAMTAKSDANRKIAQAEATIEYTTDKRNFEPLCGRAPDANVGFESAQVALTSRKDSVLRYSVNTPVYACEETQGDGSGGNWHGFYDRSGDKAQMLNDAIMGVGKGTAKYLVAPFQQGKPRSWRQFADLITSAAQQMKSQYGIDPAWTNEVLYRYKQENMVNLGYAGSTDCGIVRYEIRTYEVRAHIEDITMIVETNVRGGKLLPNECETFSISWNGREVSAGVSTPNNSNTSDYNKYAMQLNYDEHSRRNKVTVTLTGKRIQANPPYLVEHNGSTISSSGGTAQLTLRNAGYRQAMQVPEFANACKLSATAVFFGKKGSFWSAKSGAALKTKTVALDGNSDSTTIVADGITLKEKERAAAKVTTAFASGCPFYNTSVKEIGSFD